MKKSDLLETLCAAKNPSHLHHGIMRFDKKLPKKRICLLEKLKPEPCYSIMFHMLLSDDQVRGLDCSPPSTIYNKALSNPEIFGTSTNGFNKGVHVNSPGKLNELLRLFKNKV